MWTVTWEQVLVQIFASLFLFNSNINQDQCNFLLWTDLKWFGNWCHAVLQMVVSGLRFIHKWTLKFMVFGVIIPRSLVSSFIWNVGTHLLNYTVLTTQKISIPLIWSSSDVLQITYDKGPVLVDLLMKVIQYLSVTSSSPFRFKGAALQKFVDLLKIVFRTSTENTAHIDQLKQCFKVSLFIFLCFNDPVSASGYIALNSAMNNILCRWINAVVWHLLVRKWTRVNVIHDGVKNSSQ